MYCGVKAQNYYIPDDNGGQIEIQIEGNQIGISGLVYNDNIPSFEDLIDFDEKCISFYPDIQWWRCGNRGDPAGWANSESFLYVRRIMVHDGCEETCIRLKNRPERDPICFKKPHDKKYLTVNIDDACGNHLQRGAGDVDDEISFSADLYFNNTEGVAPPAPTLHCCIRANGRNTWITLTREGYPPGNIAHYSGSGIFTPRQLAGGGSGPVNIKFGASYVFWSTTSMQFQEYSHAFEVTGLKFGHEIPLSNNNGGMTHCIPYETSMNIGEIISLQAGGWPSTLCGQTRAVVTAYDYNSNIIGTSNATVVSGNFETDMSSSGYMLSCPQGQSETFDLRYTIKINGGPEREIRPYSGTHVEVYNGFDALKPKIIAAKADTTIYVNGPITLEAGTDPNLAPGVADDYEWQYEMISSPYYLATFSQHARTTTFTATGPGTYGVCYIVRTGTGVWAASEAIEIEVKPRLVIDSPPPNIVYFINETPAMPEINCRANIEGVEETDQQNLQFNWKIKVSHYFANYDTIKLSKSGQVMGVNDWPIDWGTDFCGGELTAQVAVKYGDDSLTAELKVQDSTLIRGLNPDSATIAAYLAIGNYSYDEMKLQMQVIAGKEGRTTQFFPNGITLVSRDTGRKKGIGLMQITNNTRDPNIFWSWKANADCAKTIFIGKWEDSKTWFDRQVRVRHLPYPTCDEELYDTYCRYNGGRYYTADTTTHTYIRNTRWNNECGQCDTHNREKDYDNIINKCLQSGCCYADDAMEIHRLIRGF